MFLQIIRERCGAKRPIAFPDQKLRRVPAIRARNIDLNELREGLNIGIHAPKILVLRLSNRMTEPSPDRIHKQQIGLVEQSIQMTFHLLRSWRRHESSQRNYSPRAQRNQ